MSPTFLSCHFCGRTTGDLHVTTVFHAGRFSQFGTVTDDLSLSYDTESGRYPGILALYTAAHHFGNAVGHSVLSSGL
jgi:hypothetical protein